MRRTKATLVYARTKNIRAVQLLLGHTKIDNTIRYLGIEIEDAIKISRETDCQFNIGSNLKLPLPQYELE
tara:strand:+ start:1773 stop:1982 length:210 start_codon:yes stop_codon:yes gene_type:complete